MSMVRRLSNLFLRSKVEREIDAELRSHIEMRGEDNIAAGMSAEEARRDARIRFGNVSVMKERVTAADAALTLDSLGRDARYAVRQLRIARVYDRRAGYAGAGDWSDDGDLQRGGCCHVEAVAFSYR
jgi:hypothetical protein